MASTRAAGRRAAAPSAPPPVGVGDIFATAFARYAGGFVTFGLLAAACAAPPAAVVGAIRLAGASGQLVAALATVSVTFGYLVFVGCLTALIGRRTVARLAPLALTALPAAIPLALLLRLLGEAVVVVLPFLLPFFALVPVVAGAGDAAGLAAYRRAVELVARRGYPRALGVTAGLELAGALLLLGFWIAFAPLGTTGREIAALGAMILVFWPISGLVFRNLYGALDGRLVIRRAEA